MSQRDVNAIELMYKALCVVFLDPAIKAFLEERDPKALDQVDQALSYAENNVEGITIPEGRALPDFEVQGHYTIYLLQPLNQAAQEWIDNNIPPDSEWYMNSVVIEHRYIADIIQAIYKEGMQIRF